MAENYGKTEVVLRRYEGAIAAVKAGKMGWLKAAKVFNVPPTTLRRHTCDKKKVHNQGSKGLGRFQTTFNTKMWEELVKHLKDLDSRLGLPVQNSEN